MDQIVFNFINRYSHTMSESELKHTRRRGSIFFNDIQKKAEKIQYLVNNTGFFINHRVKYIIYPDKGITFWLYDKTNQNERLNRNENENQNPIIMGDNDIFCSAKVFITPVGNKIMHISYVNSPVGYGTGYFMLYLQLLLAVLCDINEVALENFTDNPALAAEKSGIYGVFDVDMRGKNRSNFTGKTLAEKLYISEGQMVMRMRGNFLKEWSDNLESLARKIGSQIQNRPNPWKQIPPYLDALRRFISSLQQTYPGGFHNPSSSKLLAVTPHTSLGRRTTGNIIGKKTPNKTPIRSNTYGLKTGGRRTRKSHKTRKNKTKHRK